MAFTSSPLVRRRRGVSMFQMMACLAAVGGGVWVGAQYMGVELEDVAYTALDESQMLDKVPEDWRPELSACPIGECPETTSPEEQTAELREELEGLRLEVANLRQAAVTGQTPELLAATEGERALQRDSTLAYWARLCEVANQVADLHTGVEPAMKQNTTGHAFDLRRRAYDYGKRSIESIDLANVDPQATEAGTRLLGWYEAGAEFYTEATRVWDGMAGADRSSAAQTTLEKSRKQHGKHTDLLRGKLAELSSLLSRRYAVDFPPIGL